MWKRSHDTIVEGVEPFKLHSTSLSYTYKVFEHLIQLWMGICLWSQNDVKKSWSGVFAPPANALGLSIEEKDLLFCTGIGR